MKNTLFVILLLALLLLCACSSDTPELTLPASPPEESAESTIPTIFEDFSLISPTAQLMCIAETEEEAQEIAELYGITLVEYGYGVASFFTEENPREVIKRGQENGWPELSLNSISTTK